MIFNWKTWWKFQLVKNKSPFDPINLLIVGSQKKKISEKEMKKREEVGRIDTKVKELQRCWGKERDSSLKNFRP